jgi:RNA polymerase sigma factor (TIGR02999 family)
MEITELIHQWKMGDSISESRLFSATYTQFKALAKKAIHKQKNAENSCINLEEIVHSTTSLVHDAYLKLSTTEIIDVTNRKEFYLLVAKAMRHILVDYFRKRSSQKRDATTFSEVMNDIVFSQQEIEPYIALDDAIVSLEQSHARPSEILQLKHFFGLKNQDISHLLKVSESTIEKDLKFARGWITFHMNEV